MIRQQLPLVTTFRAVPLWHNIQELCRCGTAKEHFTHFVSGMKEGKGWVQRSIARLRRVRAGQQGEMQLVTDNLVQQNCIVKI